MTLSQQRPLPPPDRLNSLVARQIQPGEETALSQCYRLRYDYFVKQRGWVTAPCPDREERDHYDSRALHLGVFSGKEVVAYLRILPHNARHGFMLDHDFAALLSDQQREELPRAGAIEISRLVCCWQTVKSSRVHPLELLLELLYNLSLEQGFERCYIVVEECWLRPFVRRFGVPFQIVGQPQVFAGGTRTVAAMATVAQLETALRNYSSIHPISVSSD